MQALRILRELVTASGAPPHFDGSSSMLLLKP